MDEATSKVKNPAIGLLVVGILGAAVGALSLISNAVGMGSNADQLQKLRDQGMEIPAWADSMLATSGTVGVIGNLVVVAVSVFIAFAAMKMMKLQSRGLVMTAAILAMIPCFSSCCCVAGIPIGIWTLIVLNKPDVRSAFGAATTA